MAARAPSGVAMVTSPKPRGRPLARSTGILTSATLPWEENNSISSWWVVVAARLLTHNLVFMMFHSPGLIFSITPGIESDFLSTILRRVADPVEPFRFTFVHNDLLPPLLDSIGDRLGKQPGLFGQLDDGQADEFQ